jgi:acetyl-CoA carboxylase carboxyl transferase subunit beta
VFASWGSLGHVTVAEPGALVGFLGPRVYHALYGAPFPPGVQTAENLHAHGLVDAVRPPEQLAEILDRALRIMTSHPTDDERTTDAAPITIPETPAWESVLASRRTGLGNRDMPE